ncbi:hypothetical protein I7I50_06145 [Histoplasma capsulatum G186AR]|uniref:Uncharacterized protein n=1 Tax=Ajellomyces capsulatus TaxID=5037 RepID=A0A8H7YZZ1_AJECA|nr:hypothetical protein I7I52_10777 [Histoplasma capsulatum]QSS67148.1 hypothetical protein I7I50_06145 [Histoplasma capsulatum G186AR]
MDIHICRLNNASRRAWAFRMSCSTHVGRADDAQLWQHARPLVLSKGISSKGGSSGHSQFAILHCAGIKDRFNQRRELVPAHPRADGGEASENLRFL